MKTPITLRLRAFTLPMKSNKFASSLTDDELIAAAESGETLTGRQQKRYEKIQQSKFQLQIIDDMKARIPAWGVWGGQSLTFDTETLNVDRGQVARFGVAQLRGMKYYELVEFMQANNRPPARDELDALRDTYIFYHRANLAVEGEDVNDAIALLQAYCGEKGYKLISQTEFVTKIFLKHWYIKDDIPMPIMVIGHNLPFDIGALAVHTGFSEGRDMFGGFSIAIADPQKTKGGKEWNLPRVRIKKIGVKKYRIKCTPTENAKLVSHTFIDTLQLSKALQGAQTPAGMDYLCQLFKIKAHEDDESYGKQHADHFKPLTDEYIQYCRDDVERTWQIYVRLRKIYVEHNLSTPIDKISSEASVGKAYYKELGITPFLELVTKAQDTCYKNLMLQTCGIAMEAMAGARAECRCRHQIREGMGADFKSEYPTINYLLGLQDLLIAERVDVIDGDANGEAAQFLRTAAIADLLSADKAHMLSTWRGLRGYALVDPADGVWPVRTLYTEDAITADDEENELDEHERGKAAQSAINIGVNRVAHGPHIWVSFLDILASKFTTGVCPKIIKTRTLIPVGKQTDLRAIKFFGDDKYIIDLTIPGVDFFKRVIDMRGEIKAKRDEHKKGGDEYNRLDAMQMALKLLANATSYGILVQFDVDESNEQSKVDVYYGDKKHTKDARKTIVGYDGARKISGFKAEKPGKWFSPWGPLITAGGRLLIAIAEALAKQNGIEYGMCDTDSMFFIRPINPQTGEYSVSREEFRKRVMSIADLTGAFQNINPYEPIWNKKRNRYDIDPVLSVEDINYAYENALCNVVTYNDPKDVHYFKSLKPLYILSISAKRYSLANITRKDGTDYDTIAELNKDANNALIVLRKVSGHGLGHISAPGYSPVESIKHLAVPYNADGTPLYNDICKGKGNPRLFLDMWHTAFRQFLIGHGKDSDAICRKIDKIIKSWKGLEQPQFQQRSLNTATAWKVYKNLPNRRPFQFFNVFPSVNAGNNIDRLPIQEMKLRQDVSLYSEGGSNPDIEGMLKQGKGIYWNNDSQFAHELIDDTLRLKQVKESIGDYFNRAELKSVGKQGVLRRHSLCIFDIEYIGKESNYLLESDIEEGDSSQLEDMSAIPAFRTKFNPRILRLLQDIGLDKIAAQCGTTRRALMNTLKGIREQSAGKVMAHIRKCLVYNPDKDTLSCSNEIRKVNPIEKETNETLAQLHKVYINFRKATLEHNNKLTKLYIDRKLTDDEHKEQTRVPIVMMAEAMDLLPGKPQLSSTLSDVNSFLGELFIADSLREFVADGYRIMKCHDGEELFISYDAFKAKVNLISGVTQYKAKVENFARDKTMLRKSVEFRQKENRNRRERKTNNQAENAKELAQPIASWVNKHCEPYKDMPIIVFAAMQLLCLFVIMHVIKSSKDIQIALNKAIRTPKRSAISAVGIFNDTLTERLTVKREARKERQRQLLATRRAVKKSQRSIQPTYQSNVAESRRRR
jgi:hypothetical protein